MNNEITRRSLSLGLPLSSGLFQLAANAVAAENIAAKECGTIDEDKDGHAYLQ